MRWCETCQRWIANLDHVCEMEPVPKPVEYPKQWVVVGEGGIRTIWDSLAEAQRNARSARRVPPIGILHLRTDGTTEMLEIES